MIHGGGEKENNTSLTRDLVWERCVAAVMEQASRCSPPLTQEASRAPWPRHRITLARGGAEARARQDENAG